MKTQPNNPTTNTDASQKNEQNEVANTANGPKDGQNKCEKCGSTEISLNVNTGKLRCHWCRHEQAVPKFTTTIQDIATLKGQIVGAGASDATFDDNDAITLKCSSCAAEVIINTAVATQARCHWCRNTLSINNKVKNGAVPDKVLPFSVKKANASAEIEKFVAKRQFFAHPKFKAEFTTANILGVYLPYMVVDANVKAKFTGDGEILLRSWTESKTVGTGKNKRTVTTRYYDADRYSLLRNFDMTVEGLTIESNSEKLKHRSSNRTNNVIDAIKPFDLEQSVRWDANFMTGFTAENRDTNIEDLRGLVEVKIKDIARHQIRNTITNYNRGVRWKAEELEVIGKQWKAAYFPVWLYSYQKPNKNIHYVAVNGQTLKTMGSVPLNHLKLLIFSLLIGALAAILLATIEPEIGIAGFFIAIGGYYWAICTKYRNKDARHAHENNTKATTRNMTPSDTRTRKIRRTTSARMSGDNSATVKFKGG